MPNYEDINSQQQMLATHRAMLRQRLNQLAIHGDADAPPVIVYDITHARAEIKRIKSTLASWGVAYENQPDDEPTLDAAQPMPRQSAHTPSTNFNFYGPITSGSTQIGGSQHIEEARITMGDEFNFSGANISGSNINVKSKLDNVIQSINCMPNADESAKQQLEQLLQLLNAELQKAPAGNQDAVEAVAETAKDLVEKASKDKPNKSIIKISVEGLKQAAADIGVILPAILPLADQIVKHIQSFIK